MKDSVRKGILQADLSRDMVNGFTSQVAVCAVLLGLLLKSWTAFGLASLLPFFVYGFSSRYRWLKIPMIILCILYIACWSVLGYLIGSLFGIEASIVLCIILTISGIGYNLGAISYFKDL